MKIETSESTKAKIAEKLGFIQPSAFDTVDRSKYENDEAYLDAVVEDDLKRNSAEYQAARRRLAGEYRERQEAEQKEAQEQRYREIRSAVQLDALDKQQVDSEAAELARRDLAAGKIPASRLGATIADYAEMLTEEKKDSRAASALFNSMLRRK